MNPYRKAHYVMPAEPSFLRIGTVLIRTGLSRATLYRMMAAGTFPRQVKLGARGMGWRTSDIDRWIADPAAWRADNDNAAPAGNAAGTTSADALETGGGLIAANDNDGADGLDPEALRRVNNVVMQIARLIGRRMAREEFAARMAAVANDNDKEPKEG
jgi:prophage regulatory protein